MDGGWWIMEDYGLPMQPLLTMILNDGSGNRQKSNVEHSVGMYIATTVSGVI